MLQSKNGSFLFSSETDFNALDFNLWKNIGSEFMIKSNINNWIACAEGNGSLINWMAGSLKCRLIKNVMGMCEDVIPDTIAVKYTVVPRYFETCMVSRAFPKVPGKTLETRLGCFEVTDISN